MTYLHSIYTPILVISWQIILLLLLFIFFIFYSYAGLSFRYSLTLGSFHSAGQQMRRKLMAVLRLKCHALFLDLKVREIMVLIVLKMHTINTIYSDPMVDSANRKKNDSKTYCYRKEATNSCKLGR